MEEGGDRPLNTECATPSPVPRLGTMSGQSNEFEEDVFPVSNLHACKYDMKHSVKVVLKFGNRF